MKKLLAAATGAILLFPMAAHAAPTISILSPASGESISKSAEPEMLVIGEASFDAPVPSQSEFYLRNDGASDCSTIHTFLATEQGSDVGCLYVAQPANEVLAQLGDPLTWDFPAEEGLPLTLNSGALTGTIVIAYDLGVAVGAGQAIVTITGQTSQGQVTLATKNASFTATPATANYPIALNEPVAASLAGTELEGLSISVVIRGVTVGTAGYVDLNGASHFSIPTLDGGLVEVSTSATFAPDKTVRAEISDGEFSGTVVTPAAGNRRVYARAVQGSTTTTVSVPITVTS